MLAPVPCTCHAYLPWATVCCCTMAVPPPPVWRFHLVLSSVPCPSSKSSQKRPGHAPPSAAPPSSSIAASVDAPLPPAPASGITVAPELLPLALMLPLAPTLVPLPP